MEFVVLAECHQYPHEADIDGQTTCVAQLEGELTAKHDQAKWKPGRDPLPDGTLRRRNKDCLVQS